MMDEDDDDDEDDEDDEEFWQTDSCRIKQSIPPYVILNNQGYF